MPGPKLNKHDLKIKENSWLAKIAALKLGTNSVAMVLGKTIHLHNTTKAAFLKDESWVKHEFCHIRQFKQHGYVGFIFGSIKANPWWSTVLMPVIFLFSAMVSGIALVMFLYMAVSWVRKVKIDMNCLDEVGKYLFYVLVL